MLDSFLDTSNFYEFPSFQVAIYSLLLALVLSSVIAITYKLTYRGLDFPFHFFQAMVLSGIVTSTIMMAVGNNLAIGIGIIGVVAVIRFRTQFQNTRNIIFMFAALSIGVATGVYGYAIAVAGTTTFCLAAFGLYFSPYGKRPVTLSRIEFTVSEDQDLELVMENLRRFIHNELLIETRTRQTGVYYEYLCEMGRDHDPKKIIDEMKAITVNFRIRSVRREELM